MLHASLLQVWHVATICIHVNHIYIDAIQVYYVYNKYIAKLFKKIKLYTTNSLTILWILNSTKLGSKNLGVFGRSLPVFHFICY